MSISLTGRVSWFGGPHDSSDSGKTALGLTTATPGIAVYNQATLGGYWQVRFPNGKTVVLRQTDIGPAPWTGKKVDVTYSALHLAGYNEGNFPTGATVTATYLGKSAKAAAQAVADKAIQGGANVASSTLADGGLFSGLGDPATHALLYIALIGAGVAVAGYGASRLAGVKSPIKDAAMAAAVPK